MAPTASTFAPVLLPISILLTASAVSGGTMSTGRQLSEASTQPVSARSERRNYSDGTVAASGKLSKGYQVLTELPGWLAPTVARMKSYAGLEEGWKGQGSEAPSESTINDAITLASQFATEMPNITSPMVSADDDGSICLYWRADPMMATVSVYGDGTFAFYAEGHDEAVRSDEAQVGKPLPSGLISAMTGAVVSGLIAA